MGLAAPHKSLSERNESLKVLEGGNRVFAKVVHLYAGLDLVGSKQTISSRDAELEITPIGVKMVSRKTKRVVLLPWSNVKGCELLVE